MLGTGLVRCSKSKNLWLFWAFGLLGDTEHGTRLCDHTNKQTNLHTDIPTSSYHHPSGVKKKDDCLNIQMCRERAVVQILLFHAVTRAVSRQTLNRLRKERMMIAQSIVASFLKVFFRLPGFSSNNDGMPIHVLTLSVSLFVTAKIWSNQPGSTFFSMTLNACGLFTVLQ